jgi:peptide-methionine (R)-S-oxide reductase
VWLPEQDSNFSPLVNYEARFLGSEEAGLEGRAKPTLRPDGPSSGALFDAILAASSSEVKNLLTYAATLPRLKYKMMLKWPDVLNLAKRGNPAPDRKVIKTDAEWRQQLSDEEYHVTRQAGTERAFSSEMCSLFEPGIYSCLCCETVLFDASEKFESHTGWPSFTQPIKENVIAYRFDGPAFLKRVETVCNTCEAHLGHVFPDGPAPSGLRYCMNAVALQKIAKV